MTPARHFLIGYTIGTFITLGVSTLTVYAFLSSPTTFSKIFTAALGDDKVQCSCKKVQ